MPAQRRRCSHSRLVSAVVGLGLVLAITPIVASPAHADWNNCANHVVTLDPVPGYASAVRTTTDTNTTTGELGVCVMTLGGCGLTPCFITGANATADFIPGHSGMTGVLVRPQTCWQVHPTEEGCVNPGTNGAQVNTNGDVWVCILQICQFL